MAEYQLEGQIMLAPRGETLVDFSDAISRLTINTTRELLERPKTYGNPNTEQRAGSITDQVTFDFIYDESDTTGLWDMLYDTLRNGDAEVDFSAVYGPGAVSATNRMFTGTFLVVDIDTGTAVSTYKTQSKTFPARAIVGPLSVAPS